MIFWGKMVLNEMRFHMILFKETHDINWHDTKKKNEKALMDSVDDIRSRMALSFSHSKQEWKCYFSDLSLLF